MFILSLDTIICLCILLILNFVISKIKYLIDKPEIAHHKYKHKEIIPLSGGIYFFLSLIFLSFLNNLELKILFFLIPFLIIGIVADIRQEFSPKIRLILQVSFIFVLVYFNDVKISSIDLNLFDQFLEYKIFNLLFVIFCLVTVLNGHNFMDGLNSFVIGNFILILLSIYYVELQVNLNTFEFVLILQNLIIISLVFFLFNAFGKCFLGDNGIYVFSLFISFLIISFIENSNGLISPLMAAIFLWYPAFENLFSILRRIKKKEAIQKSDTLHLHTLIKYYLNLRYKKKYNQKTMNTMSAIIINSFLLPNFVLGALWYNNSIKLTILIITQIFLYIFIYNKLLEFKS